MKFRFTFINNALFLKSSRHKSITFEQFSFIGNAKLLNVKEIKNISKTRIKEKHDKNEKKYKQFVAYTIPAITLAFNKC